MTSDLLKMALMCEHLRISQEPGSRGLNASSIRETSIHNRYIWCVHFVRFFFIVLNGNMVPEINAGSIIGRKIQSLYRTVRTEIPGSSYEEQAGFVVHYTDKAQFETFECNDRQPKYREKKNS